MLHDLWWRARSFFGRDRLDDEMDEEIREHLQRETEKFERAGLSHDEAQRQAQIAFGGRQQVREECREARGLSWLETTAQDLRYCGRTLAKSPGFTLVVVATLALGIGACTAIFSLVSAVLMPPLPYGNANRLVYLYTPNAHFSGVPADVFSPANADFADLKRDSRSFAAMTQFDPIRFRRGAPGAGPTADGARVDGDFFATLEATPELGRTIDAGDNEPGHGGVALISDSLWRQDYGHSRTVLGAPLELNGKGYRVIGVMPPGFHFPHNTDVDEGSPVTSESDVWIPLALTAKQRAERGLDESDSPYALARLKPGVSVAQAQGEMSAIMKRLEPLHPMFPFGTGWGAYVKPFRQTITGSARPLMILLMGAVGFVLLIACGNAANLLLARSAGRTHELGVRATLGAGRRRLIRQLLTESLALGAGSGVAGIGMAWLFLHLLFRLNPGDIPRLEQASLDLRVLLFVAVVVMLTSVLTGILPALASSRVNLAEFLRSGGSRGAVGGHSRMRSVLIVAEVAMVVVLLAGAGLLVHSYIKVEEAPVGFSPSTLSLRLEFPPAYARAKKSGAFLSQLLEQIRAVPGVQAAGAGGDLPLSNTEGVNTFWAEGYANQVGQTVEGHSVSPGYFEAMGTPVLEGRGFAESDDSEARKTAIVNEAFVEKYFAGSSAIGKWVTTNQPGNPTSLPGGLMTIVGVVADVRHSSLEAPALPQMYVPLNNTGGVFVAIRSVLPTSEVIARARAILKGMDPSLAFTDVHTMSERISEAAANRRFQTVLLTVFSAMAMALAVVGLYGLLAFAVRQRRAEIGVRIALGASRRHVVQLILRQGLRLVLVGLALGTGGAFGLTRVLSSSLYEVRAIDPLTFLIAPTLLLLAAVSACLLPGWRAANIDPVESLRCE